MPKGGYVRTSEQIARLQERNKTASQREKTRAGLLHHNQQTGTKSSQYPGVFRDQHGRWMAAICFEKKNYHLSFPGTSEGERQAALQYQQWVTQVQAGQVPIKEKIILKSTEYFAKDAAHYLGISLKHLYKLQSAGKLDGRRIDRYLVFTKAELDRYKNAPKRQSKEEEEKISFFAFLGEVVSGTVQESSQQMGRPRQSIRDMVFCMLYRAHTHLSVRRVRADLELAKCHGCISAIPHFNTILKYLSSPATTPLLCHVMSEVNENYVEEVERIIAGELIEDDLTSSKAPTALVNERICRIIVQEIFHLYTESTTPA